MNIRAVLGVTANMLFCSLIHAASLTLDFGTNPTLPSAQGLTYVSQTGTPESSVFSVSNGLLHMDSLGQQANATYQLPFGFDSRFDASLQIVAKVFPGTTTAGFDFELDDSLHIPSSSQMGFYITSDHFDAGNSSSPSFRKLAPFNVSDGNFHVFLETYTASTGIASLFVDSTFVMTFNGEPSPSGVNYFGFGDFNFVNAGKADIASIRYVNAVPEPTTVVLLAGGLLALVAVSRFRTER